MAIPNLPPFFDMKYTDDKGNLTSEAHLFNDNMWQTLNMAVFLLNTLVTSTVNNSGAPAINAGTIVNQGVKFPNYTTAEITALAASATKGTVWFDTDAAKLKVLTNDTPVTIETIQSV